MFAQKTLSKQEGGEECGTEIWRLNSTRSIAARAKQHGCMGEDEVRKKSPRVFLFYVLLYFFSLISFELGRPFYAAARGFQGKRGIKEGETLAKAWQTAQNAGCFFLLPSHPSHTHRERRIYNS